MHEFPKAEKVKKRRFSPVWLTPILALVITVWLIINGYIDSGKEIRVQFDSGSGIVIGKTPLQYRGIVVGKVIGFEVADTLDKVNVVIKLDKKASGIAKEGMMFWVVKPRLSIDRITGLETIISGSYIEIRPPTYDMEQMAKLKEKDFFIGYPEAPGFQPSDNALNINLLTGEGISLSKNMTVLHKGVEAGRVAAVVYDDTIRKHRVTIELGRQFKKYINSSTRFWSIGGIDMKLDTAGFVLSSRPLANVFQGGIAFDSEYEAEGEAPLAEYELFSDFEKSRLSSKTVRLHMRESYGVKEGRTPVMYKGVKVGLVTDVSIAGSEIIAEFSLYRWYEKLTREETIITLEQPELSLSGAKNMSSVLAGVFLNLIPGDGDERLEFNLYEGEVVHVPEGSTEFTFLSDSKGSADIGTGIYFKGVRIGVVTDYRLRGERVLFNAVIFRGYSEFASADLYLWETDALNINVRSDGLDIKTAEFARLLEGGINAGFFGTGKRAPMKNGEQLKLYRSEDAAKEAYVAFRGLKKLYLTAFDASRILKGAPILYRGVKVGEIGNSYLKNDTGDIRVTAIIDKKYRYLINGRTYFWKLGGVSVELAGSAVKIDTPMISELITGGIAFDNNAYGDLEGINARLFEDKASAESALKDHFAGRKIKLYSENLNLPSVGVPVYYKGVKAGEVSETGYDQSKSVSYVSVIIFKDFKDTVTESTRFWKGGEVDIRAEEAGIRISSEPAAFYLNGSLHYETFLKPEGVALLYKDRLDAEKPDLTKVSLYMKSAYGLKEKAPVMFNGGRIGYVDTISYDGDGFDADVLIYDKYADYLRAGALFWVENVQVSLDGVSNTDSLLYGPKLFMEPGRGDRVSSFQVSDEPASPFHGEDGLRLVLVSESRNSLEKGSPVYYRQVQTGAVEWVRLSDKGDSVETGIFIKDKYRHLVRKSSVFKSVSGVDASFGFFSGFKMKAESVKSILKGGVSFTTAETESPEASEGGVFYINDNE
jgi:paraquat-inducible protein B